ncbi:MAG: 2-C-methyl-D-erythritol 2,4-cyclodiphosphate synthase [Armatimonadota bacterium]|nr:2-C-methyl-D-erythritol 2,4-cyclodiphosphate synthase [Armatimonadota bacterium]MDR5689683.1 2-C-methyl-D-erythritol 2,4-cyclodiphosphate synthase [Armatimonadota bacterium]MDR7393725.1 2-C-methyl-D-erythritol 2,4-cyclodiphosphate synthase [Armatimonadota bacterium]MDR7410980.1 2-C-methyl-D-erythritol 2,4-cyclodiphosphate synthase [Armatimonadota bacterium]MDR7441292.1 2-C-methyl-D-erythritol 2,4-cyclodiphosphate synthase [Armatimonadota bacterium]
MGIGYDVHPFTAGRPLVLGGVTIPYPRGLGGHSDADVLTHAVMDAVLGACGLPDIGTLFPSQDPRYEGADSLHLLEEVLRQARDRGFRVVQVDCVVVAQEPRLADSLPRMRQNLAARMGLEVDAVGLKATTPEGLGALGRGEGVAALAVALVEPWEA